MHKNDQSSSTYFNKAYIKVGQVQLVSDLYCDQLYEPKVVIKHQHYYEYVSGLVQDWSNSTANTLELLQSCVK